jgi:hypothetical protein
MGTSSSWVLEGSPLAYLLKKWKDINYDNFAKRLRFSFALRPGLNIPWRSGKMVQG